MNINIKMDIERDGYIHEIDVTGTFYRGELEDFDIEACDEFEKELCLSKEEREYAIEKLYNAMEKERCVYTL